MTDDLPRLLTFIPCPICGAIEQLTYENTYRITHDYAKHGIARVDRERMSTENLMNLPNDCVFDRVYGEQLEERRA